MEVKRGNEEASGGYDKFWLKQGDRGQKPEAAFEWW